MLGCVNSNSVIVGRLRERCHLILLRSSTSSWSLDTLASETFQEHDTSHGSTTDPICSSTEQECVNEVGNPLIRSAFRYRRLVLKPRYTTKSEAKVLGYRSPKNLPISIGCRVRRYISTLKAVHDHHVAEDVWVRKNTATNTEGIKSIESCRIAKELQLQGYTCRQREILVHYYGKKFRRRGDILNELQEKRVGRQNKMDKDVLSIFSTTKPEGEGVREEDQIIEEPEIELIQGRDGTIAQHHMNSKIGMVAHDRAFEKLARFSERTVKSARHAQYPLELGTRAFTTNAKQRSQAEQLILDPCGREPSNIPPPIFPIAIRDHLKIWQGQQNIQNREMLQNMNVSTVERDAQNLMIHFGEDDTAQIEEENEKLLESEAETHLELAEPLLTTSRTNHFFKRGDVVELFFQGEPVLATFVRNIGSQSQFYTMQGRWTHRSAVSINFMLPEMISPSDIDPIIPYLPSEPISINQLDRLDVMNMSVPREVGAEVLEKMRRFHQSANDIMRTYAGRLSNAFKIMAHPTKTSQATLQEIAVRVLQINRPSNLTSAMLWAVYRMISKNAYITAQHFQYRASQRFDIISKKDAEILEEVRGWLRQYQEKLIANVARMPSTPEFAGPYQKSNPFPSFIFKAQAAIKASRKLRAVTPSGILGPSSLKSNEIYEDGKTQSVAFNSRERKIIDFIRQWSIPPQVPVHSIVGSIGPMILRFIGMYDGFKLERSIGFLLLQELGCIAPWAHHADRGLVLTLSGLDTRYLQDPTQESGGEPIADLETSDQMREFRKDWKDMAVFAIDSAQTVDVDDGLSLETVAGDPSTYWVHIHVANPSAFLAPDAEICRSAARMMESLYFPDKSYPMFPNSVTQKHFSLDQNRPCITFSAKITKEGEVVQSKISHGVVRNVKRITPEKLQQLLNRNTPPTRTMTLGGEMSQPTQKTFTQPLEVSDIEILRKLCEIAIARCRKRQFQAAFNYVQTPDVDIKVLCPTGSALSTRFFGESTKLWIGDPSMSLKTIARINEQSLQEDSIGDVVGNYMILAGEVAASWCSQRNIPIAYLGFLRSPEPVMPPEQYKRDFIDPATAKGGIPPYHLFKRYMELLGKSIYSTRPLKHIPLGVAEYCRVTSPLRRYPDLMTHWQIEAAIFHEAQSSTSLVGTTSDCYLPFSRSRVESVLPRMRQHETSIRTSKTFARRHWQLQWLARAFYFQEAPLPETFELYVYTSLQANYIKGNKAWINGLSISCFIRLNEITKQEGGVAVGDWWEGRIVNINCYHQQVLMEPIRLLKKTQWQDHAW